MDKSIAFCILKEEFESNDPSTEKILSKLIECYGVSHNEANEVLYDVVLNINKQKMFPLSAIELLHSENCNLRCKYCFEGDRPSNLMPRDITKQAIDFFFDYSGDHKNLTIVHFGGEPLLNFNNIVFATNYANEKALEKNKQVEFSITTNGILLDDDKLEFFSKTATKILLSLDGSKETHDSNRIDAAGNGTYDRVMESVRKMKKFGFWVGAKMTVDTKHVSKLSTNIMELHSQGVNQFLFGPAEFTDWSKESMDEFLCQTKIVRDWYRKEKITNNLRIDGFDLMDPNPHFGCRAGRNSVTIMANGDIIPCAKLIGLEENPIAFKLGDIKVGLYNLRARNEFSTCSRLRTECQNRGISKDYQGGCYATNYFENKDIFTPNMADYEFKKISSEIWNCV